MQHLRPVALLLRRLRCGHRCCRCCGGLAGRIPIFPVERSVLPHLHVIYLRPGPRLCAWSQLAAATEALLESSLRVTKLWWGVLVGLHSAR